MTSVTMFLGPLSSSHALYKSNKTLSTSPGSWVDALSSSPQSMDSPEAGCWGAALQRGNSTGQRHYLRAAHLLPEGLWSTRCLPIRSSLHPSAPHRAQVLLRLSSGCESSGWCSLLRLGAQFQT